MGCFPKLLIFRPGVELEFDLRGQTPGLDAKNILVKEQIATVKSSQTKEIKGK